MALLAEFERKCAHAGALVAGVLSGTSADGIDVALARVRTRGHGAELELAPPELVRFDTLDFEPALHARVRRVLDGAPTGLRETALLHRDLGRAFGRAASDLAERCGVALDLVGSHGQTVWHHDGVEASGPATLQLGDGDFVAEECGAPVVSDFRQGDLAAGGEGAPISALADDVLFGAAERPCAVLNLGGMANLTLLFERRADTLAFDTGPAGSLLDGLSRRLLDRPYDDGGRAAARGRPREDLVDRLLLHPFLAKAPPKSTGRDTFGAAWVEVFLRDGGFDAGSSADRDDALATAVEFVAASVALALARFAPRPPNALYVAGGGVHNRTLLEALARRTGRACRLSDEFGVPADAREGLVFAVLAARAALGLPVTVTRATGARPGRVLGKVSLGSCSAAPERSDPT
ncbi:MAG: anhydro-N-acetylmuramic acid kinase [Planctomycetes bacterium]|nr:anhydro-N-acetylmuramic acid kinase [Planctomycetota bacterium]